MSRSEEPFDTYLLRVLCTLISEKSVSRAAIRLNQSQPAISAALRRLRAIFNDPLLVRDKNRMVPTARALQAVEQARAALGLIDGLLSVGKEFVAETTQLRFTIAMPDYLAPPFMARVVQLMRAQAPGARLVLLPLGQSFDYEQALQSGEVDIVIGNWPSPPEHLHMSTLLEDEVVCLMDEKHPLAVPGRLTAEHYLQSLHVVFTPYSPDQRGVVESSLGTLRLSRDGRVQCSHFSMAPDLLVGTDLLLTTSRHFAVYHARRLPLALVPLPMGNRVMRFYQLWHSSRHRDASHIWLRALLSQASQVLTALT
ncbi:LysR family transcriptional regulator [uncultured Comamonas sp.]|uniref:LysR family transcriptional regulator n=1 Tax=uncultured Comamonas sp. TaxID=114710 RepID=UPI0025E60704|nr:LysR family transcriptional regulator [uncultured Comamonas sp.]